MQELIDRTCGRLLTVFLFVLCWGPCSEAGVFPTELSKVIARYAQAKSLRIQLEKKITVAALDKTTTQVGQAWLHDGRLRLEFGEPNRSLVVVDPSAIWLVTYLPEDLGGVQVSKARRGSEKETPVLLKLLAHQNPAKDFTVTESQGAKEGEFEMLPKVKNPDCEKIRLKLDPKTQQIAQLVYWDELGNKTDFTFAKTEFDLNLDPKLFRYSPPKNVKVTEY